MIRKMHFNEVECQGVDWIQLTQDRVHWRALLSSVMSNGYHKRRLISLLAERLLASQGGLCYMELVKYTTILNAIIKIRPEHNLGFRICLIKQSTVGRLL